MGMNSLCLHGFQTVAGIGQIPKRLKSAAEVWSGLFRLPFATFSAFYAGYVRHCGLINWKSRFLKRIYICIKIYQNCIYVFRLLKGDSS